MQKISPPSRPFPVWSFFALTYFLSWLIWIPLALAHFGLGPVWISEELSSVVRLLGVLMPAAAALILTAAVGGRAAVGSLMARLLLWRVRWVWWLAAIAVFPALLLAAALLYSRFTGQPVLTVVIESPSALLVNIIFLAIAAAGEEIGWRGVALPALLRKFRPIQASLILGLLWATWHLPFWVLLDTWSEFGPLYFVLNYLFIVPMTLYMTWFFIHSRSSVLLPVASHLTFNILNVAVVSVTASTGAFALFIALVWLLVAGISPSLKQSKLEFAL
jgi:membrane protease YdiL (CAAX protease family)